MRLQNAPRFGERTNGKANKERFHFENVPASGAREDEDKGDKGFFALLRMRRVIRES